LKKIFVSIKKFIYTSSHMKKKGLLGIFENLSSGQFPQFKSLWAENREAAHEHGPAHTNTAAPEQAVEIMLRENPEGIAVGLDVGSSKIVALVGRLDAQQKIEILGFGEAPSEGLIRGSVVNLGKTAGAIREALHAAIAAADVEVHQVITNYSGLCNNLDQRGVIIREDMIQEIGTKDIIGLKKEMQGNPYPPGEQIVYLEPQHFIIDDEPDIRDPIGMAGQRFESDFHVITGEVTGLNNLQKCVRQSKVGVKDILPTAIASAEAVICEEEKEEGIAVIDIGAAVTSISVYKHGIMRYADTILLGGNTINADIKEFTGLSSKQAELMKKVYGAVLPEHIDPSEIIQYKILNGTKDKFISKVDLALIIQSRMEELIGLAYDKIEEALKGRCLTCGIVFTGGDSKLPNLRVLGEQITGLKCHGGSPTLHLKKSPAATDLLEKLTSPAYATSIGLLKMGLTKVA
jgi:cell division protein FtsA